MIDGKRKIKFQDSDSEWIRSFSILDIKCLIVCRGPVRKEAMDIFDEIGIREYGILLSEKDSIVYPMTLAPELRNFKFKYNIHRIPDYMGSGAQEKKQRIEEIIEIAKLNKYTHIFAGYGFMAEDAEFIEAIEKADIVFMGPSSSVAIQAGAKDEAKKIARSIGVSVTPGIDNISTLTLLRKAPDKVALEAIVVESGLDFIYDDTKTVEENAELILLVSYKKSVDVITVPELQKEAEIQAQGIWDKHPQNRIRLKYIGGGGGKGQRVLREITEVKGAVMEVLAESKVVEAGSNRNFLIELNIENTRHNEIQLIGNGEWCIALGGRDCSLQMHEQKLLEISVTKEMLEQEIEQRDSSEHVKVLAEDLHTLRRMEEEGERFGKAVGLNSVSTFECIVEGANHFFMEMNTRIQVEHRVTEMVYKLKFVNPNGGDYFIIESLIELMALISVHGKRIPKPQRILRNLSGGEVRINATNQSLQPHAGGIIFSWTPPVEHEIRDDQGIGIMNPDTGLFIHYRLAGAYDSNIALIVTYGNSRKENLERLSKILCLTELRGQDLQTNLDVHYGLINWILGKDVMFKPSTKFMFSYLAAVGALHSVSKDIDMDIIWEETRRRILKNYLGLDVKILDRKITLITRPIRKLIESPHLMAGYIGYHHDKSWKFVDGKVTFLVNPIFLLNDLYNYLDLEQQPDKAAVEMIWAHDRAILDVAMRFYKDLEKVSGLNENFTFWDTHLKEEKNPCPEKIDEKTWTACIGSHFGFQLAMDLIDLIAKVAVKSGFVKLGIDKKLDPVIPTEFLDFDKCTKLVKGLTLAPAAKSDEIVTPMGGMFYSKEAPNLPILVKEGERFEAGQPLFIIEVMKMFNKISVPYSGTIVKCNMVNMDGKVVAKGQTIFKIIPDEIVKEETEEEIFDRRKSYSLKMIDG